MDEVQGGFSTPHSRQSAFTTAATSPSRGPGAVIGSRTMARRLSGSPRRNSSTNPLIACWKSGPRAFARTRHSRAFIEHLLEEEPCANRQPLRGIVPKDHGQHLGGGLER